MEKILAKNSLFIPIAKIYFVATGYVVYLGLARFLSPEQFGVYGIVVGIVSILNMVFVTGTLQSVSKFISQDDRQELAVQKSALMIQLLFGGAATLIYILGAPVISDLLHDRSLIPYLRTSSIILFFYSFYAVFIGILNGKKQFKSQAFFDMAYSTLRIVCILGVALFTKSVGGAIAGFAVAAVIITFAVALKYGVPFRAELFPLWPILRFALAVMGVSVMMNVVQQADLLLLKALTEKPSADLFSGYYTAALSIARVPYMILISLGLILFPLISQASYQKDRRKTAALIRQGLRIGFILAAPAAILFSAWGSPLIHFLYPAAYAPAGEALSILAIGYLLLTLLMMTLTLISGTGHPHLSFFIILLTLISQLFFAFLFISKFSLQGAAWSTTLAAGLGLCVSGMWLYRTFGTFLDLRSSLRIIAASLLIYGAAKGWPAEGILLPALMSLLLGVYLLALWLMREWKWEEIKFLWKGIPSKKS